MRGDGLGVFKGTAIVEIGGDAGGAEGVIADGRGNAGVARAAVRRKCGAEKRTLAIAGKSTVGTPFRPIYGRPRPRCSYIT